MMIYHTISKALLSITDRIISIETKSDRSQARKHYPQLLESFISHKQIETKTVRVASLEENRSQIESTIHSC